MARVDTLTAYSCKFRYLQRNNPLINDLRNEIRTGKTPSFTFSDFISIYDDNSSDILIGKNSDRTLGLSRSRITLRNLKGIKSWHISPLAGKQGQPMTVIKRSTGKKYDFGSDAAALYNYHLFAYENNDEIIVIFHRQNGSGCKSVFLETANNILKEKGIKLEMDLIVPLSDTSKDVKPTKLTLQYIEENPSSDIADNLKKKKIIVRDIGLNLEVQDNSKIAAIIHNMQLGKISKETAFVTIKEEVSMMGDFNDAEVKFKIGKRTRKTSWNEFENIIGVHDISEELHTAYRNTRNFIDPLTKLADEYYYAIVDSGVVRDE